MQQPTPNILTVEQFFAGTNYLEDLKTLTVEKLTEQRYPGSLIKNTPQSIFNKFSTFGYARSVKGTAYDPATHFIGYEVGSTKDLDTITGESLINVQSIVNAAIQKFNNSIASTGKAEKNATKRKKAERSAKDAQKELNDAKALSESIQASSDSFALRNQSTLANPTASNIIKWSKSFSHLTDVGFQPYSMTDFAFCKYYGKIPNNRLVTLRRYPFPIDDSFRAFRDSQPIPIAQAVTWFGGDTANTLSSIGVMNWDMPWEPKTVTLQDVTGNEVTVDKLIKAFESSEDPKVKSIVKALKLAYVAGSKNAAKLQQITGMEAKLQDYTRKLYDTNGPYWNRVYGPVNVINKTSVRSRGMQNSWATEFSLNFHYSFRSFNGLSPKIVALDLIASFLNLTYNDGQFLDQLARYFPAPGLKFDPTTTELIGNLLTKYAMSFDTSNSTELMKLTEGIITSLKGYVNDGISIAKETIRGNTTPLKTLAKGAAQVGAMVSLMEAIPNFISVKAALSDRPVGEWHLVVGNPMNPIMVMGDIICKKCTMKFDDEMGPDDFPTGVTFTVNLQQGKPRDKVAVERMFNLGRGKMMVSPIKDPSSAGDTLGKNNNSDFDNITKAIGPDGIDYIKQQLGLTDNPSDPNGRKLSDEEKANISSTIVSYRNRIRRSYGYRAETTNVDDGPTKAGNSFDDSLLMLYYDRGQHKM